MSISSNLGPEYGHIHISEFEIDTVLEYLQDYALYQRVTRDVCHKRIQEPSPEGVVYILIHYLAVIRTLYDASQDEVTPDQIRELFFQSLNERIDSFVVFGQFAQAIDEIKKAIIRLPQIIESQTCPHIKQRVALRVNAIFEYVQCRGCDGYIHRKYILCPNCGAYRVSDPVRPRD